MQTSELCFDPVFSEYLVRELSGLILKLSTKVFVFEISTFDCNCDHCLQRLPVEKRLADIRMKFSIA